MGQLRGLSTRVEVILPDVHMSSADKFGVKPIDRHDPAALSVAFQIMEDLKPDGVTQIGDLLHLAQISSFQRRKDMLGTVPSEDGETIDATVRRDMDLGNIFWDTVQRKVPKKADLREMEGNHEELLRVSRNMASYRPYVDKNWYVEEALNLKERGIKWIPYQRYGESKNWVELSPKLWVIHGQYVAKDHARKHHDAWGHNLIYGHLHTFEAHSYQSIDTLNGVWTVGCLCTPTASYHRGRLNAWRQGMAVVYIQPSGKFNVYFIDIIKGQAVWNGKVYSAKNLPGLM